MPYVFASGLYEIICEGGSNITDTAFDPLGPALLTEYTYVMLNGIDV